MARLECIRCGACCLEAPCFSGIYAADPLHEHDIPERCPWLSFDDEGIATCELALRNPLPFAIGQGCCRPEIRGKRA